MKTLNDIYPLTIVKRRFGGYAVVNAEAYLACVDDLQCNEEWHYGDSAHVNMEREAPFTRYGIGEMIDDALENYFVIDVKISARDEEARNRVLTEEEKREVEELARKMSKAFPPLGTEPVVIQPMNAPTGKLFYFDALYKDKKDDPAQ